MANAKTNSKTDDDSANKDEKREVRMLGEHEIPHGVTISRLGDKIVKLSAEIDLLEHQKRNLMSQLGEIQASSGIDYNVRGDGWTYEQIRGRTYLNEKLLVEAGVKLSLIAKCKKRGASYWQIRRDREKNEKE